MIWPLPKKDARNFPEYQFYCCFKSLISMKLTIKPVFGPSPEERKASEAMKKLDMQATLTNYNKAYYDEQKRQKEIGGIIQMQNIHKTANYLHIDYGRRLQIAHANRANQIIAKVRHDYQEKAERAVKLQKTGRWDTFRFKREVQTQEYIKAKHKSHWVKQMCVILTTKRVIRRCRAAVSIYKAQKVINRQFKCFL